MQLSLYLHHPLFDVLDLGRNLWAQRDCIRRCLLFRDDVSRSVLLKLALSLLKALQQLLVFLLEGYPRIVEP